MDFVPVSVLSVIVPAKSPHKMHLAVGKGSGSFELWICDISSKKIDKIGPYDAHNQTVSLFFFVKILYYILLGIHASRT